MKIKDFKTKKFEDKVRVSATVIWEDSNRPAQKVFFETGIEFADGVFCNPNAFLVGCILPALRYGEKRIFIDEEICPELIDGLITVMSWMRHWYYEQDKALVQIEVKKQPSPPTPRTPERAGLFLSGGIDSLGTLRANRINYPPEHPASIKDGIIACGFEVWDAEKFKHVTRSLSEIARDAGVTLIPVNTNIRWLGPSDTFEFWSDFWSNQFMGAAFFAIAHTFSRRFTKIFYSASYDTSNMFIWGKSFFTGSHPLIDTNFSSSDLSIVHYSVALSRLAKVKLISKWDAALKHLRVCNVSMEYKSDALNCGECEKCLRAKLSLMALGMLEKTTAFRNNEISTDQIKTKVKLGKSNFMYYYELVEILAERGFRDYAKIIKRKLLKKKIIYHTVDPIKDLDNKHFSGNLRKLKNIFYKKGISD